MPELLAHGSKEGECEIVDKQESCEDRWGKKQAHENKNNTPRSHMIELVY
jgi:hypothetical protein